MVSLVNSHTNATGIGCHLWEVDLRFAPGWTSWVERLNERVGRRSQGAGPHRTVSRVKVRAGRWAGVGPSPALLGLTGFYQVEMLFAVKKRQLWSGKEPGLTKLVNPDRLRYGLGVGMEGPGKAPMNGVRRIAEMAGTPMTASQKIAWNRM